MFGLNSFFCDLIFDHLEQTFWEYLYITEDRKPFYYSIRETDDHCSAEVSSSFIGSEMSKTSRKKRVCAECGLLLRSDRLFYII